MIDRVRAQIQHRLDELSAEADRLRKALAALDPRAGRSRARQAPAGQRAKPAPAEPTPSATASTASPRTRQPAADAPRRTAPGATKASVLAALAGGEAMTASQVAEKTGLARGSVSTTLSKLTKTGEVQKADRGYRLAPAAEAPAAEAPAAEAPAAEAPVAEAPAAEAPVAAVEPPSPAAE